MTLATALEHYMLDLINGLRARNGLDALTMERNLNRAADGHSAWMGENQFGHTGEGGSTATQRIREAGTDLSNGWQTRENVGARQISNIETDKQRAKALFDDLVDSPGHLRNMLADDVTHVGIGFQNGFQTFSTGRLPAMFVTQNFAASGGVLDEDHYGNDKANTLTGGRGDDAFTGLGGNDVINGRGGRDIAVIDDRSGQISVSDLGNGSVRIVSADGSDTFHNVEQFKFNNTTLSLAKLIAAHVGVTETGTTARDVLDGTEMSDTLSGGMGNDKLTGLAGSDLLKGDSGRDKLIGGAGDDTVVGHQDNDTLIAGRGDDRLIGGGHDDKLVGGKGDDFLKGGGGDDNAIGGGHDDTLIGGAGDDSLSGGNGHDLVNGGGGNDTLTGGKGHDTLKGGSGDDVFVFHDGMDRILDFNAADDSLRINGNLVDGRLSNFLDNNATKVSGGVRIDFGGNDTLDIRGDFTMNQLENSIDLF